MSSNSVLSRARARRAAVLLVAASVASATALPLVAQTAGGAPTIAFTHANVVNGVNGTVLRDSGDDRYIAGEARGAGVGAG